MVQNRFLIFELSRQSFCIDALSVVEVIDTPTITKVPLSKSHISGMLNFRGEVVSVTDLGIHLGLGKTNPKGKIVIVSKNTQKYGLQVDSMSKIIDIDNFDSPESFSTNLKYLMGTYNDSGNIIQLLDLKILLASLAG
jgi:chemotaxis signal transduction protein